MSDKSAGPQGKCPSDYAKAQVGEPTRYVRKAPNGKEKVVEGVCIGVRASGTTMRTEDGDFPGVQFLIETRGRKVWTMTMADNGVPLPPDRFDPKDVPSEDRYGR